MACTIVQIYEIQTPAEARDVITLGADHIGSVITDIDRRHDPEIQQTIRVVREMGATSSLIPLYSEMAAVIDTLAYYRPDIVHFCEQLGSRESVAAALALQAAIRHQFPDIRIMRAIPIAESATTTSPVILELAARLEPSSDFFLTDTVIGNDTAPIDADQPVSGFVGITGRTCDWSVAARLVDQCCIPVILAGGISPENVAEGIRRVRPYGVDSCTCTNARDAAGQPIRFKKDLRRVEALIAEARRADGVMA